MKKRTANVSKSIFFLCVLALCILAAVIVVRRKDSDYKYADFFDKASEDQIDVLFMGSSHVINAVNPAVLYHEYGITSYNMGGHGSVMQATYWELIEALQYCTPKWVVVDAYMLEKNYQYLDVMDESATDDNRKTSIEQLHLNMDAWPLDRLKLAAITDLIQDSDIQKEFLFDFIVYHDRWNEVTSDDYRALFGKNERSRLFGAEVRYDVEVTPLFFPDPDEGQTLAEHTVGEEYLMKIIDECQRRGIGILVTYIPCSATTDDKIAANSAGTIAGMYDAPYINMLNMDIINMYTDLNDTGHLNVTGAIKVTDYLGEWLTGADGVADHRTDEAYADWEKKSDAFYAELKGLSANADNIYTQINLLSQDEVSSVIYINDGSGAFEDSEMKRLIRNISGSSVFEESDGPYILINDVASGKIYEAEGGQALDGVATGLGNLVYQPIEHNFRFLYAKENEENNFLYDDERINYDIQIITYDNESGEVLSHNYYRTYGGNYER